MNMKKKLFLTAVAIVAALCTLSSTFTYDDLTDTEKENMWWDVLRQDNIYWGSDDEKLRALRAKSLKKLKIKYDSLNADYIKKALGQDLSKLSMNDLLTLRSGIYAANGLMFKDNNLYSRFINKKGPMPWYAGYMCYLLELEYWKRSKREVSPWSEAWKDWKRDKGLVIDEKKITLNAAEEDFVDKIDRRVFRRTVHAPDRQDADGSGEVPKELRERG